MAVDPVDEAIAHFAGLLRLVEEAPRDRLDYRSFDAPEERKPEVHDPEAIERPFTERHDLRDFDPGVSHTPRWDPLVELTPDRPVPLPPPTLFPDQPSLLSSNPGAAPTPGVDVAPSAQASSLVFNGIAPTPGSHAVVLEQNNALGDRDRLDASFFDGDLDAQIASSETTIEALTQRVEDIAAMLARPDVSEGDFAIEGFAQSAASILPTQPADGSGAVETFHGVDALGIHVDGETVDEAPTFEREEEPEDEGGGTIVTAGGNTLINQFAVIDASTAAPVIVTLGDAVAIDAIVQINAWDVGLSPVGRDWAPLTDTAFAEIESVNVAAMSVTANPVPLGASGVSAPATWFVARLEADLVNVTWSEQTNLIGDEDAASFSVESHEVRLVLGDDTTFNLSSILTAGELFDLIVVTGDVLHANLIEQTNIIANRDGFELGPDGVLVSAGGDTLWNTANIITIGETRFHEASTDVEAAARDLADGGTVGGALEDLIADAAGALRVLVIEGDMIDLTVARQTNVLGDDDMVAALASEFEDAGATGVPIEIEGGGNLLLNAATIVEAGVDTDIHVAGQVYSDALLVQADLIGTEGVTPGVLATSDPSADPAVLASEAVVFLQDDAIGPENTSTEIAVETSGPVGVDVMQAMVG